MSDAVRTIGILGGKGMLGSDLVEFLGKDFETTAIDKEDYDAHRGASFDALINANGNSRRFWANQHPAEDLIASTVSVEKSMSDFVFGTYVYISSSDVYENHESPQTTREDEVIRSETLSPYGLHKYLAEQIVRDRAPSFFILRSSMILGRQLKKGPFYDMLEKSPLFITAGSRLQAITTAAVAQVITLLLGLDPPSPQLHQGSDGQARLRRTSRRNEVFNMGGKGTFEFKDLAKYASEPVAFREDAERQIYEMNVEKLGARYPLRSSTEYVEEFLSIHGPQ